VAVATSEVSRTERVLNVLALLLGTPRPLTRDEITREVMGYPEGAEAARRAFERDKETLRAMGVPIRTDTGGEATDIGYRVVPGEYYLPDLGLDDDETVALRVALNAVALTGQHGAGGTEGALRKLGGLVQDTPPIAALPLVPALGPLFDAHRRRAPVTFGYRGVRRTVEPWALRARRGRWYLIGWDRDRQASRTFRADRVDGAVEIGEPGTVEVPADVDTAGAPTDTPWELGEGERFTVRVAFDPPHEQGALDALGDDAVATHGDDGRVLVEFQATNAAAVRTFVLGFLDHAELLEPDWLRAELVEWLRAAAAGGGSE
jgi:predicted DNA-binding transcriptional regulator YafY